MGLRVDDYRAGHFASRILHDLTQETRFDLVDRDRRQFVALVDDGSVHLLVAAERRFLHMGWRIGSGTGSLMVVQAERAAEAATAPDTVRNWRRLKPTDGFDIPDILPLLGALQTKLIERAGRPERPPSR